MNMIQMSKIDHYDGEELLFCKKAHIKTQGKNKDVQNLYIIVRTKNSNLFDKNCTQETVKLHIQHEES